MHSLMGAEMAPREQNTASRGGAGRHPQEVKQQAKTNSKLSLCQLPLPCHPLPWLQEGAGPHLQEGWWEEIVSGAAPA